MLLIAVVFGAMGTAIGSVLQDMQGPAIMNSGDADILPLRGAVPLTNLPAALRINGLDPLSTGSTACADR
jgi:ABC-2 type transport system permease protein